MQDLFEYNNTNPHTHHTCYFKRTNILKFKNHETIEESSPPIPYPIPRRKSNNHLKWYISTFTNGLLQKTNEGKRGRKSKKRKKKKKTLNLWFYHFESYLYQKHFDHFGRVRDLEEC